MPLHGPIIVVGDKPTPELTAALAAAGAFPVVDAIPTDAFTAVAAVNPSALILAEPDGINPAVTEWIEELARLQEPLLPVFARVEPTQRFAISGVLPVATGASHLRLVARLKAALRVRAVHATLVGRTKALKSRGVPVPDFPHNDPLEDATVLVAGRGRSYPALSTAIGGRVGLIGALSVETAAQCLKSRDVDGIVIGDGFSQKMVDAFLTILAEDARFRDLPIALAGIGGAEHETSNLTGFGGDPEILADHFLPFARLRAFDMRVRRMLKSLDAAGTLDPGTGLMTERAFLDELNRAIGDAEHRGVGLSIARFGFTEELERRASLDAARLTSQLVREIDFGCRDDDGSIVVVFTETDLRHAHVVARRIASMLKRTMLHPGTATTPVGPNVTLATLKSTDDVATLMARIAGSPMLAAE